MLWLWLAACAPDTGDADDTDTVESADTDETEAPVGCPGTRGPAFPTSAKPRHIDHFLGELEPIEPITYDLTYTPLPSSACVDITTDDEVWHGVDRTWLTGDTPIGDLCDGFSCFEFQVDGDVVTLVRFLPDADARIDVTYSPE